MKVYLFGINLQNDNSIFNCKNINFNNHHLTYTNNGNEYYIYAFTSNKSYAKEFNKHRIFKMIEIDIPKARYSEYRETYEYFTIIKANMNTKAVDKNNKFQLTSISVICTKDEYETCTEYQGEAMYSLFSEVFSNDICKYLYSKQIRFKKDIDKALYDVLFLDEVIAGVAPIEEINYGVLDLDEFTLFITLYEKTMRG